ncbi:MAG: hypothetical protein EBR82_47330 [Caulobacteraceae bacterium]|nr:hypothetical protein [Caulobacteraceae bacterium]
MTKQDKIAALKAQYPTLRVGSDEAGYTELNAEDYEATIAEWADNQLATEAALAKAEADKKALLAKLGITDDEAKLLLS